MCESCIFPDGNGAGWSPLNNDGKLNVSATRIPNASNSKIDGLAVSTSSKVPSSFKPWLRITFGSPKLDPTTPQKRTSADKHWCWRDVIVAMSTIDFLPPSRPCQTEAWIVNAQVCQTTSGIRSSVKSVKSRNGLNSFAFPFEVDKQAQVERAAFKRLWGRAKIKYNYLYESVNPTDSRNKSVVDSVHRSKRFLTCTTYVVFDAFAAGIGGTKKLHRNIIGMKVVQTWLSIEPDSEYCLTKEIHHFKDWVWKLEKVLTITVNQSPPGSSLGQPSKG